MNIYVESMIILPFLVFSYQLYSFSARGEGVIRQERCLKVGVFFMTSGIMALVFKLAPSAFFRALSDDVGVSLACQRT